MAGQLRVDEITDEAGTGSPSFPFGLPVGYAAGGTAPAAGSFTEVPDDVLEPGDPIRSVDIIALRDNPIAIAGGAAGAPRVVTNAIQDAAVNLNKIKTGTNSITVTTTSGFETIVLSLGRGAFFPQITSELVATMRAVAGTNTDPDNGTFSLQSNSSLLQDYSVFWRFINI